MNLTDAITFATEHPVCFLATTAANQPHVRGWLFWFADETGFYFQTLAPKDVYHQLKVNPKTRGLLLQRRGPVHGADPAGTGEVEFLDDPGLKHRLLDQEPWSSSLRRPPRRPCRHGR